MSLIDSASQFVLMTMEDFNRMVQQSVDDVLKKEHAYDELTSISEDSDVEQLLSRDEVAKMLGVDLSTLWRWAKSDYLPCVHLGRKVKYLPSVVKLFVERNKGRFPN